MFKKFLRVEYAGEIYLFRKKRINIISKLENKIQILMQEDESYTFSFETASELEECFLSVMKQIK